MHCLERRGDLPVITMNNRIAILNSDNTCYNCEHFREQGTETLLAFIT